MAYVREALQSKFWDRLVSADTKEEINALYNDYGTHIITAYTLGGWAESSTATVNTSTSIGGNLKMAYSSSAGANIGMGSYGFGISTAMNVHADIKAQYNSNGYVTKSYCEVIGGAGGVTLTGDPSVATNVYNEWISSINTDTAEIVVDEKLELLGIWNILPEKGYEVQKARMEQVFMH